MTNIQTQLFTTKEAAEYLRLSELTLWRLRRDGKLGFHRIASRVRYTQMDLDDFLNSSKQTAFAVSEGQ